MPRSRGSEMSSQRQSPRVPLHLKSTAASEANSLHRLNTDRSSPKPDDHRSPRSGPLHHEKKRGTRVVDLESKLGQAQEELRKLKEQLASSEAAKQEALSELEETKKQISPILGEEKDDAAPPDFTPFEQPENEVTSEEAREQDETTTDVFEVVTSPPEENNNEEVKGESEVGTEIELKLETEENEKPEFTEQPEITELKAKLAAAQEELEIQLAENAALKKQLGEAAESAASAKAKEDELIVKLGCVEEELRESRVNGERLGEKFGVVESAKLALEAEMKRVKVQAEQWRKAAEAAAAVLSADGEGRRMAERCGSMDKHIGGGYGADWSPAVGGEEEEGMGGGKRKSGGIRMFGDLWKKKGQQHK